MESDKNLAVRLLAAIVESSDDAIISKTLEGIITSWNRSAERILGYTAEEAIGKSILLIIPPDLIDEEKMIIEKIRRGERVDHMETVRVKKDGTRIPLSLTISPIRDEDGKIIGASKIARDISQRKQIEAEREDLLKRAETANMLKDEFLATLSHELRNPLNAVIGWVSLLQSGRLPADRVQGAWETVRRNLDSEVQLIADLLDVSRIMSGRLRLDVRPFEMFGLVEESIEVYRPAITSKNIRIDSLLDPTAGPVAGDPSRLQQVLSNLLSNAVKFTPKGGRIQVILQKSHSSVEIAVSDNGSGIPADFLPHVFERFRQHDASTSRQFGGLGLGLTIVQRIVQLHGGTVQAFSEGPGKGATFTVTLPLMLASRRIVEPYQSPSFHGVKERPAPSIRGLRVLAIDDDADTREFLSTFLRDADAEVKTADSAATALNVVDQWRPNVILCDIGMPAQDGYSFIEQLRKRPSDSGGRIPAAALTAYAGTDDRLHILSAGFQMHLSKPVQPAELLAGIAALAHL